MKLCNSITEVILKLSFQDLDTKIFYRLIFNMEVKIMQVIPSDVIVEHNYIYLLIVWYNNFHTRNLKVFYYAVY